MANYVSTAADRAITRIKQVQDLTLGTVSSVTGIVGGLIPELPALPLADRLPTPEKAVKTGFGIAEDLLKTQKQYALQLAQAFEPITSKVVPGKPRKAAAKKTAAPTS
jgi:hypothetical protein